MNVPSHEWTEEYIQGLIDAELEESIKLDYKACDALEKTEGKKREISKDVSAFANSLGGEIIYGVKEYDDVAKKHLPETLDSGFEQSDISKEWLEQVINSNIQPRIEGLIIHPVSLSGNREGKYVYVVIIPQSHTAHQAKDHKYYKRYNFESVPMEDYEIRDVMNRRKAPIVKPEFSHEIIEESQAKHEYKLKCKLVNTGSVLVKNWAFYFAYPIEIFTKHDLIVFGGKRSIGTDLQFYDSTTYMDYMEVVYRRTESEYIFFPGTEIDVFVGEFVYYVDRNIHNKIQDYFFYWSLFADDMPRKDGFLRLRDYQHF